MNYYSVGEAARILSIHKDTLRYYDKIGLFHPTRGENGYRYYTESDLLELKYIEVMKFANLSLSEIGIVMRNRAGGSDENLLSTIQLLDQKQTDLREKVLLYNLLIQLIAQATHTLKCKQTASDAQKIDQLVSELFTGIRERNGFHE